MCQEGTRGKTGDHNRKGCLLAAFRSSSSVRVLSVGRGRVQSLADLHLWCAALLLLLLPHHWHAWHGLNV